MKILLALLTICCIFTVPTAAQNSFTVKGLVIDTTTHVKIHEATIIVLDGQDSILQKFTYSNKGAFELNNLRPGKFLIFATYPDYADFVEHFTLDEANPVHDFGNIMMILKSKLLNEVIIKARVAAIKIKGDTTEFNASAYATQKNAKVEDLLKQLPGMRINQSGVIIFQGETVSKVLVDGEEFFSDDPSLVTKNIRADMVSKVQVYNQKSEQAKLTGIEDGVKVKTINVVLTEDKKKGLFGKADAGYGTDDYYTAQLMANKFSPKQKVSVYGNIGNTGKVGLSGEDNNKFGDGYSQGDYGGNGIPLARDAGAHYNNKWNKDNQSINVNYKAGALTTDAVSSTISQNNLPGNFNTSSRNGVNHRYNFNQSFNGRFNSKIDSTADISTNINAYRAEGNNKSYQTGSTLRGNGVLQNTNTNSTIGENMFESFAANARYTKRFKKKGRSISINTGGSLDRSNSKNNQKSELKYYNELGVLDSTSTIDQFKPYISNANRLSAGFSYTDMLTKAISITAGYNFSRSITTNDRRSFNLSGANRYEELDSAFSSDFKLVNLSSLYSLSANYSSGKLSAGASTSLADASYKQEDQFIDFVMNRKFINLQPGAYLRYQLSKAASLSLDYNGNTNLPSSYQLQPLRQNSDPLNISLGNPDLKSSFSNRFSYNYRVYQPTRDQGINFNGNYSFTTNAIVSNRVTDSAGVNTLSYSNLRGGKPSYWNMYAELYGHATKLDFILYISLNVNGNAYFNYVNNTLNKTSTVEYKPQIDIGKNTATYSYGFSIGSNYVVSSSSLQSVNNNRKGFFSNASFYTKLPNNFFIGADAQYNYMAKNRLFNRNFERLIANAYFGKNFLKEENLKLTIRGNDLFNQNTGYERYSSADGFTESRNTTIRRYFILSLTWDFTKFGKSLQKQQP
ncbi:TonB-dependent receptor [Pedobacter ginsengisoli]|uniref:TonB-dependent receptor n=1 Tax=Pedobacter ginsengisoli TaxID=363852 RepID=A0A2D1UAU2_9SPHI|nr:TonB-dependent receptor [Pedobacter ginsengisoli]ATP58727.1 TonB-dependent receptor [Pedobacter ginsengisoli]